MSCFIYGLVNILHALVAGLDPVHIGSSVVIYSQILVLVKIGLELQFLVNLKVSKSQVRKSTLVFNHAPLSYLVTSILVLL